MPTLHGFFKRKNCCAPLVGSVMEMFSPFVMRIGFVAAQVLRIRFVRDSNSYAPEFADHDSAICSPLRLAQRIGGAFRKFVYCKPTSAALNDLLKNMRSSSGR